MPTLPMLGKAAAHPVLCDAPVKTNLTAGTEDGKQNPHKVGRGKTHQNIDFDAFNYTWVS